MIQPILKSVQVQLKLTNPKPLSENLLLFPLFSITLTDLLITETNGLDLICTNGTTPANIRKTTTPILPPLLSTSPFIHPLSQYAFPSAQSSIVASKASQTPHTQNDGRQTSQVNKHHTVQWFI